MLNYERAARGFELLTKLREASMEIFRLGFEAEQADSCSLHRGLPSRPARSCRVPHGLQGARNYGGKRSEFCQGGGITGIPKILGRTPNGGVTLKNTRGTGDSSQLRLLRVDARFRALK